MKARIRMLTEILFYGRYERWRRRDESFRIAITRDRLTGKTHCVYEIVS